MISARPHGRLIPWWVLIVLAWHLIMFFLRDQQPDILASLSLSIVKVLAPYPLGDYKSLWILKISYTFLCGILAYYLVRHSFSRIIPPKHAGVYTTLSISCVWVVLLYLTAASSITWIFRQSVVIIDRFVNLTPRFASWAYDWSSNSDFERGAFLTGSMALLGLAELLWVMPWSKKTQAQSALGSHLISQQHPTIGPYFARSCTILGVSACLVIAGAYVISRPTGPSWLLLTPAEYEIWHEVRNKTPRDSLIFTDQTADDLKTHQYGFPDSRNYYAPITAQRHFFVAAAFYTLWPAKRVANLLETNNQVLLGHKKPDDIKTRDSYSSYYAVVEKTHPELVDADLLYENGKYRLYRFRSKH